MPSAKAGPAPVAGPAGGGYTHPRMSHRFLAPALVAIVFLGAPGALLLSSCSDDPAATADVADATPDAKRDRAVEEEEAVDAAPDVVVPPVILPNCVGSSIALEVSGVRAFVNVQMGSKPDGGYTTSGDFVVDYGSISSTIDLQNGFGDAGAPTPRRCGADAGAGEPGIWCEFDGFDFFGNWGPPVTLTTADHSVLKGFKRQAGILATDFLSSTPFTLDFRNGRIHRSQASAFCSDAQLLAAGLRPLPTQGFFSTSISKLRPLSEVLADAGPNIVVPNVPTVPITIDGEPALAQLDTGYEDRLVRNSINVNEALLARLLQANKVTRAASFDLFATTCVAGLNEKLLGYKVNDGAVLEFVGEGGAVARRDRIEAVYLKKRSDETFKCGGVSTWTSPAAQVGASFFIDAQALVVDPETSRVWIPKN